MSENTPLELVVASGPSRGARVPVGGRAVLVGRAPGADLVLADPHVSRRHVQLAAEGGALRIRRVAGAARVRLNGRDVDEAGLAPGDVLFVGRSSLRLVLHASPPSARADGATGEEQVVPTEALLVGERVATPFAAIAALAEELREVTDLDDLQARIEGWSRACFPASGARVAPGATGMLEVTLPVGRALDPAERRVLRVAGALCDAAFARLARERAAMREASDLRRLAVGGARGFLGESPRAQRIASLLPRLAAADTTVLLLGESGVGKTFLARLIHENGPRAQAPLRVLNCAAIPPDLLEAELFGAERGAFTGAVATRVGALQDAGRGTVLLDEIGEMPLAAQTKLLRVLEERRFERLGSNGSIPLQARVLVATNRDLAQLVERGAFRADLYYRVSVVRLEVPPLRERGEDLVLLAHHVLGDVTAGAGRKVTGFTDDALAAIRGYGWPGNVRELRNAIEAAVVLGDAPVVRACDLPPSVTGVAAGAEDPWTLRLPARLDAIEVYAIRAALRATGGNRTRAAALLGVSRVTLYHKLKAAPEVAP